MKAGGEGVKEGGGERLGSKLHSLIDGHNSAVGALAAQARDPPG